MTTYTEVLPGTKTSPHRAVTWTPCGCGCGVLTVSDRRTHTRYAVCEVAVGKGFSGRAFRLTKAGGAEHYTARVGGHESDHDCDCPGHAYGRGKACKHVAAVRALLANDWLDEREGVADLAAEVEAKDRHYTTRGL